ncbi:MAG: carboxy-S-adenosyl-L-methionine synthase CmoA [Chlamydiae bacterium]|nr:carboxy-S-adenosyl-L-methionine synthase CmoA [Chlamydiota bacterium]MBI3265686.1 carboxy-S-adenosyl-L-methionine synthase CmoA [Chlamydiota bacterium]
MKKDKLYVRQKKTLADFNFGEKTAQVFDDMLDRSIPLYRELQRMIGEMASEFVAPNTSIYDLGCSTGITLSTLMQAVSQDVKFVGVDSSEAMLDQCRGKMKKFENKRPLKLICADLNKGCAIQNASVVVLNLTLQFIRPLCRDKLIQSIYQGLREKGCLIVVEKVLGNDSLFNRMFIKFYYDFKKKNGYTDMEIAQKREALENVLIPYRVDENAALLRKNGFSQVDVFFKWYNFCGILGVK